MNRKLILILIFAIPVVPALLLFLPPADPLANVKTVGIIEPAEHKLVKVSQVLEGLELALKNEGMQIIHDLSRADALIYAVEIKEANFRFDSPSRAVEGYAHAVLTISRNNQESIMDLYVYPGRYLGLQAQLVGRRFWEFWK